MSIVIDAVKLAGGLAVGTGVGALVTNLAKVTMPVDVNKITKLCIFAGGTFVAGLASAAASNQFENTVDTVVTAAKKIAGCISPKKEEMTEEDYDIVYSEGANPDGGEA